MIRRSASLLLLLLLLSTLFLPIYRKWVAQQGIIPPGVTLAGLSINGKTLSDVAARLEAPFDDPVAVYYGDERLLLRPRDIGFRVKARVMIGQARQMGSQLYLIRAFFTDLLGLPMTPHDVPLLVKWDPEKLDAWLEKVARRYDRPPRAPTVTVRGGKTSWHPGTAGQRLNKGASVAPIIAAMKRIGDRRVAHLVLEKRPPPPPSMQDLQTAIRIRLSTFPGIAAAFVRLLPTGEEANVDANDIPFSGMSTMKIPILLLVYKDLDQLPRGELRTWMRETITSTTGAGNYTADRVLAFLGHGDALRGADRVTAFLRSLGLKNSFIVAPYDWRRPPPKIVHTPANRHPARPTSPDVLVQTTPEEIALVLGMVVSCAEGKGTLLAAYPGDFTPDECRDLLGLLAQNPVTAALLPAGLPPGTHYVHKHGYSRDAHGDVAAIWGPEGPYVISLFLSTPNQWLVWNVSDPTFIDISRLTWEFFQMRADKK